MSEGIVGNNWNQAAAAPLRILVVDDSAVMRALLERMFRDFPDILIAAKVATAVQAFEYLSRNQVDIVLLDHEMPGQKGLEALPRIVEMAKGGHVVMLSSFTARGSELAVQALSLGASDAVLKPGWDKATSEFATSMVQLFRRLVAPQGRREETGRPFHLRPISSDFRPGCIAIGASTGGIRSLAEVLSAMVAPPGVPILLTQHLPEAFTPYFVRQVGAMTPLPVHIAVQDMPLCPDHIYIAPGDRSLSCRMQGDVPVVDLLEQRDPVTQTRPSVNIMFSGVAECFRAGALGIVLTGMGRDGTMGASMIVSAGGVVLAQDAETSTVWGMPGSVTRSGLASAILPPAQIAHYLLHAAEGVPC